MRRKESRNSGWKEKEKDGDDRQRKKVMKEGNNGKKKVRKKGNKKGKEGNKEGNKEGKRK